MKMMKGLLAATMLVAAVPASAASLVGSSVTGSITPFSSMAVDNQFTPNAIIGAGIEFNGVVRESFFDIIVNVSADFSNTALVIAFTTNRFQNNLINPSGIIRLDFVSADQLFNTVGTFTRIGCTFDCTAARGPSSFAARPGAIKATFNQLTTGDVYRLDLAPSAGAVPEPASWAMMILGMGAIGAAMRRRSKVTTQVSYGV